MKTMKTIPKILMLTLLLSLVLLGNSDAQGGAIPAPAPVVLTEAQGEYPLGRHLELLEDKNKAWTIDDVTSPELARQFRPSQVEVPNLGFTDSAYWVRFRVRNEAGPTRQWRLEQDYAVMHYMTLFLPQPDRPGYEVQQIGAALPFNIREIAYPTLVLGLPVAPGAEETIYLRFENGASMTLPLTIWSLEAFAQKSQAEQLAAGLLFGVMLIMIGYNLFIWFSLRDKSYLYYVLFVLGIVLFMATFEGLAAQYLWPDLGQWNRFAQLVFIPIALFGALKFTATFLDTKRQAPTWHKIINVLLLLWGVMFVEAFFFNHSFVLRQMTIMGIVSFLILAGTGFTVWLRGFRPARYFLLAWILWVIAVINFALTRLGLLPSNPLTEQGFQLGLVVLVLLLALALADRINILKQEREAAVSETLQQKDEFAVALQETYLVLEQRVEERTSDLMKAKEQAEAANRVKSALHTISVDLASISDLATLLQRAVPHLSSVVDFQSASIVLVEDDHDNDQKLLAVYAYPSQSLTTPFTGPRVPLSGLPLQIITAIEQGQAVYVRNMQQDGVIQMGLAQVGDKTWSARLKTMKSWLGVPLNAGGQTVGLFIVMHDEVDYYQANDIETVQIFANQLAVAINNIHLNEQARDIIALKERNRLARELHDSVTQSLYSMTLHSDATLLALASGKIEVVKKHLHRLNRMTREAMAEMRLLIFEMRPPVLEEVGLAAALRARLEAVEARSGLGIEFEVEGDQPLPPATETELYRVALEGLNNVVKHARAGRVTVQLIYDDSCLRLTIQDDGIGFDLEDAGRYGGYGLATMKERIELIHGTMAVNTAPAAGTRVEIEVTL
jgi:signal transduction histidine kinase